ncbi:MAG: hypothetical protein FWB93_04685 [Oscillospiraceae bacterium]|nr:hypothetical protein [Oscillospiraceae bacterium]
MKCPACRENILKNGQDICDECSKSMVEEECSKGMVEQEKPNQKATEKQICPYCSVNYLKGEQKMCNACDTRESAFKGKTPTGNTIKRYANFIFILEMLLAGLIVLFGIFLGDGFTILICIVIAAILCLIATVVRAFVYGYGIIVSHYEKQE